MGTMRATTQVQKIFSKNLPEPILPRFCIFLNIPPIMRIFHHYNITYYYYYLSIYLYIKQ